MTATEIELRSYRLAPRKPRAFIEGAELVLYLPTWFGRRSWRVPTAEIVAADVSAPSPSAAPETVVFARPVTVPYLFTTGPVTDPTLLLLFRRPRSLPPLRWTMLLAPNVDLPLEAGMRAARHGITVDGVELRATDGGRATAALAAAGVEVTTDPEAWLVEQREVATDPTTVAAIEAVDRRARLLDRLAVGAYSLAPVAWLVAPNVVDAEGRVGGLLGALGACGVIAGLLLRRAARRTIA